MLYGTRQIWVEFSSDLRFLIDFFLERTERHLSCAALEAVEFIGFHTSIYSSEKKSRPPWSQYWRRPCKLVGCVIDPFHLRVHMSLPCSFLSGCIQAPWFRHRVRARNQPLLFRRWNVIILLWIRNQFPFKSAFQRISSFLWSRRLWGHLCGWLESLHHAL